MIELTNDADKMISYLYKEYLSRRKQGSSKVDARNFSNDYFASEKFFSKWLPEDISDTLMELGQKKYLLIYMGGYFEICDNTIIYMENRFKNGLIEVTDFITKFIP